MPLQGKYYPHLLHGPDGKKNQFGQIVPLLWTTAELPKHREGT